MAHVSAGSLGAVPLSTAAVSAKDRAFLEAHPAEFHNFLDRVYLSDPQRDRAKRHAHLKPARLAITVAKQAVLQSAILMAHETPPKVPLHDGKELATFVFDLLWLPVLKDVSTTELTRVYEDLVYSRVYPGRSDLAGRFTQDVVKAAKEVSEARLDLLPYDASVGDVLRARWDVAVHVMRFTAPWPALIRNAALLTVEEAALVARRVYRHVRRNQALAVVNSTTATKEEKERAATELNDSADEAGPTLLHEATELAVRAGASVVVETLSAGLGTLVLPGVGTLVFELVGSLLCWI